MNYKIKRLQPANVEEFKKMLGVFAEVFGEVQPDTADPYLQSLLEKAGFYAIAAYDTETVIGGVTGYELSLPDQTKEIYLYDLAVDEQYRKRGVATALIQELKRCAKEAGASMIFVEAEADDEGAVGFYKSLGAEQIRVEHFNINL